MRKIIVNRDFQDTKQTLGVLYVKDECGKVLFKSECIERGWLNNKSNVSCIPVGEYPIILEHSPHFRTMLWEIYGVADGRSECKVHNVNFARDLNGCIGVGNNRKDIDGDGYHDVTDSKRTLAKFHEAMGNETRAVIIIKDI